jgi:hypothetical protein
MICLLTWQLPNQIHPDSFTLSMPVKNWKQWMVQKKRHYTTGKYYKKIHKLFLGLYSISHFLYYPLFISSMIFYEWEYCLIIFGVRFILQLIVYSKTTKKLNENDLFPYFLIFDIWMFFYYLIFASSLIKKPSQHWK